jgi:arylsulfatase A-like enzyme
MEVRADRVTEEAIRWLRDRRRTPFFLWVHYNDPHGPLDPPEAYSPELADLSKQRQTFLRSYNAQDIHTGLARLTSQDREALVDLYDAEIAYVDGCIGRLLDELESLGLTESTLVIFFSDHGEEFWDHGGYQHGHTLYDELIRVPLIFRGPGIEKVPRRVTADVELLDLIPTLFDVVGRTPPPGTRGQSLVPFLGGEAEEKVFDPFSFSEGLYLTEEKKAVRGNKMKLIYRPGSKAYELYDLAKDPDELENILLSRPEEFERMRSLLDTWLRSQNP